jgi:hypothetical protein
MAAGLAVVGKILPDLVIALNPLVLSQAISNNQNSNGGT